MLIKQAYLVVALWIDFTQGRWLYVCSYFYIILHAMLHLFYWNFYNARSIVSELNRASLKKKCRIKPTVEKVSVATRMVAFIYTTSNIM